MTAPGPPAAPPQPAPGRHLLAVIIDALQLAEPASQRPAGTAAADLHDAAYNAMLRRRSYLVLAACRTALDRPGDTAVMNAARDLAAGIAALPAAPYDTAPPRTAMST